jgi:pilus assembly protein CpaE
MYPLPVVVAGCGERVLPHVRRELLNLAVDKTDELRTLAELVQHRDTFRDAPHLFLLHVQSAEHLRELKRLSGTFIGRPFLALLDEGAGVSEVIGALRAGATQVVVLPLQARDFREALDCIALQFSRPLHASQLFAVSGVTGGCGATTLAVNLAYDLAHMHQRKTILAELTLQMGMLVTYLDVQPEYTIEDLLTYGHELDVHVVEQALTCITDKFFMLAGPRRPISPSGEVSDRIGTILDYLRHLADVIVLDVPCTFDDFYFDLLACADQVLLVGEQRIPSVRNVQLVLDALGKKDSARKQHLVLNRYDPELEGFAARDLEKLLHLSKVLTIGNDPGRVTAALNQGRALRLATPESPMLRDIEVLVRTLLNLKCSPEPPASSSRVFRRLIQALRLT